MRFRLALPKFRFFSQGKKRVLVFFQNKFSWLKIPFLRRLKLKKLYGKKSALVLVFFSVLGLWIFWGIPLPINISGNSAVSTKLFDRKGKLIYEIYAKERRTPIPLNEIPKNVINATIAIEDKNFYEHQGFDILGVMRGLSRAVTRGRAQGGSTLTQQLVKNALLSPERTIRRKIREFVLSIIVELRYSKDQILEMYLNQIPYGSTAYGIGAASELYFGKNAKDLNLAEAAMLAGLTAAPTRYSPFGAHPEYAKSRQEQVLRRMVEEEYISQEDADNATKSELVFAQSQGFQAPHFSLWIKEMIAEKYGDVVAEQGGLRITTTLDLDLQEDAEKVVAEEIEKLKGQQVGNGAALVTSPGTGEILAMVGSKDYGATDEDGNVNVIFAKRQPGSSIKPLNYALAIKNGLITGSTPLADVPTCFLVQGQEPYCPSNYDGQFHGATQVRFALGNSLNIPAVRVLALNGLSEFVNFANSMGISTFTDASNYGLSLTLGGGEVTAYDMAVAFGVFANEGIKMPLRPILKIEDWKGKVLYDADLENLEETRILDPDVAFIISHILHDNNARSEAFGTSSYLNVRSHPEVSVKTGTTNDLRDNWTIGYTGQALVVTWVGNNNNTPMKGAVSGVSGASPIWSRVMKEVLDKAEDGYYHSTDKGHSWPKRPGNVVGMNVCANTGSLPNESTADCPMRFEFFIEDKLAKSSARRQDVQIDRTTQSLIGVATLPEQIETQNHLVIDDPLKTLICLTCPIPSGIVNVSYPVRK